MRKSTLFISAALTTFMLAVLFGVASAYQNAIKSTTGAYLVTFSSGDTVYVSPVGQILSINIVAVVVPTTVVSAGVASQPGVHHSNNGGVTFPKPQPQPTPGGGEGGGGGGGDD